jgi:hypothetical protein
MWVGSGCRRGAEGESAVADIDDEWER